MNIRTVIFNLAVLALIACAHTQLANAKTPDLSLNATYREMLDFKYRMQINSVPTGSPRFEINSDLIMSAAHSCVSQHARMFDPKTRSNELAKKITLRRLKRKLVYIEARDPDNNSFFLGNSADVKFNLCTIMILTGVSRPDQINAAPPPASFLYEAATMSGISDVALIMLYRSLSDSPELNADMIEGFFSSLFERRSLTWDLVDSIGDDVFTSSSPQKELLVKTYLRHLYQSPIFQEYKIYFSSQILSHIGTSRFDKKERAEIVLSGIGHLNNTVLARTVFNSFSSWDLSQEQVSMVYARFGSLLSQEEKSDAIQIIASSFKSVRPEIKQEILRLMASPSLTGEQRKALLLTVLSDRDKYSKYGMQFVLQLLNDELKRPTRDEATFSWVASVVRDSEIGSEQKILILNSLALDSAMTSTKIGDLLAYTEFYILTIRGPNESVKAAIDKILRLAPKNERTKAFLIRVVNSTPYSALTDMITWELVKNYKLSETEVVGLITAYFDNGSTSSPKIIGALVRKNALTAYMGVVIASTPNQLAKLKAYKPILEFVMNSPSTDDNTKGQIRYKLTGEIPTLKNIPGIDWNSKPNP